MIQACIKLIECSSRSNFEFYFCMRWLRRSPQLPGLCCNVQCYCGVGKPCCRRSQGNAHCHVRTSPKTQTKSTRKNTDKTFVWKPKKQHIMLSFLTKSLMVRQVHLFLMVQALCCIRMHAHRPNRGSRPPTPRHLQHAQRSINPRVDHMCVCLVAFVLLLLFSHVCLVSVLFMIVNDSVMLN